MCMGYPSTCSSSLNSYETFYLYSLSRLLPRFVHSSSSRFALKIPGLGLTHLDFSVIRSEIKIFLVNRM